MNFRKLEKSLLLRVEGRLAELLPEAHVRSTRHTIRIEWDAFSGEVGVKALTTACLAEERKNWGAIAGGFCNLVVSRVQSWFSPPLRDPADLANVYPAVEASVPEEDALLDEAAPREELRVASVAWLDGLRIEFDYRGPGVHRRLLVRDLDALGMRADEVAARANENLQVAASELPLRPVGPSVVDRGIFLAKAEGTAPGLLTGTGGHAALYDALSRLGDRPGRILACAPRSDTLYFCDTRDKAAASEMVARAWREYEADTSQSVPLSPRLFTIVEEGDVRYLDVGLTSDRVPGWSVQSIGDVGFAVPPGWRIDPQDDRHVLWTSADGPRVRVRLVPSGGGSPKAARELAERVRARHQVQTEIGHGFFNGLPWAWVDTGVHDGCATASMFVVVDNGLVILQTEVPDSSRAEDQSVLQRAIATIHPTPV